MKIDQQLVTRDFYMEDQGDLVYEPYDEFINRVTSEIDFYKAENFIDVKYPDKNTAIIIFKEEEPDDIPEDNQ